jgi:hypothetical protein
MCKGAAQEYFDAAITYHALPDSNADKPLASKTMQAATNRVYQWQRIYTEHKALHLHKPSRQTAAAGWA